MHMPSPDRMRFTLRDDTTGATPLELPTRRLWPVGLVFGIVFAIFAAIAWMQIVKISASQVRGVSDLMFVLFNAFWVLGWSVGVLFLGAVTVLLLRYRESARIKDGRLLHVPQLGPLRVICEYDLARMQNLRFESGSRDSVRVRFEYEGSSHSIGDWMPQTAAQSLIDQIKTATSQNDPHVRVSSEAEPRACGTAFEPVTEQRTPTVTPASASVESVLARQGARQHARERTPAVAPVSLSALVLVAANLLPLAGVLLFGWNLSHVMVLYWAESAVIAFYTVLKMFVVGKWLASFAAVFFVGHFGGFMAGHFFFVYGFFVRGVGAIGPEPALRDALLGIFGPLWPALIALVVSHGVSFAVNFLGQREYQGTTLSELMLTPYRRIVVMHLTVIFGGWLVMLLETPLPALILLVLLKTAADFRAHASEHTVTTNKLETSPAR